MTQVTPPSEFTPILDEAAKQGMTLAVWAGVAPERIAIYDPSGESHSFADVNANANRLARLFRDRGLKPGDSVALVCSNRASFVEVLAATDRTGVRLTPVNWHLTADEIAYIVRDCEAKGVIGDVRALAIGAAVEQCPGLNFSLSVGGEIAGFESYADALGPIDGADIGDPVLGSQMLYTSGTTGRPKGVYRPTPSPILPAAYADRGYELDSVQMCAGPAYHAAPLLSDVRAAMTVGIPLVLMDRWDSEHVLRTISERRVSHFHMVPIMFQRLLALPENTKAQYSIDHVKYINHGAAPCPPEVKRAMIDWFGPILSEYYAASEGGAGFTIDSEEWLRKPGSVGKRPKALKVRILDENGRDLPNGAPGTIYHQLPPDRGFVYFGDESKTNSARVDDFFTLGDVGYFDEDDYLFLTGRSAETIISGGVNIYPQEIDNELIKHEAVADSATVGVPHEEWGEQVKAVILLRPGHEPSQALADEILGLARKVLPSFKLPRSLEFVTELPRSEAGKIQRNKVRAPYWEGRARQI